MSFISIEPILRRLRLMPITPHIKTGGVLVDIGCDDPPLTIQLFKDRMNHCYGLDAEIKNRTYENVTLKKVWLEKNIPLSDNTATVVTMLAVLEHLDYPQDIVNELYRIVKPGGTILLTVPSPWNKPLLELLAKFRIVRPEMIAQHKYYFTRSDLKKIFFNAGFEKVDISLFQLGLNIFVRAVK